MLGNCTEKNAIYSNANNLHQQQHEPATAYYVYTTYV